MADGCKWHFHGFELHPGRLTWNLQITHLERKIIFQTSMIMFHVNLLGSNNTPGLKTCFPWHPVVKVPVQPYITDSHNLPLLNRQRNTGKNCETRRCFCWKMNLDWLKNAWKKVQLSPLNGGFNGWFTTVEGNKKSPSTNTSECSCKNEDEWTWQFSVKWLC